MQAFYQRERLLLEPGQKWLIATNHSMLKRRPLIDRMTAENNTAMKMQNEKHKDLIREQKAYNILVKDFNKKREEDRLERQEIMKETRELEAEYKAAAMESQLLHDNMALKESDEREAEKFRDAGTYQERMEEMGFEWPDDADLDRRAQLTKAAMAGVEYPVNSN